MFFLFICILSNVRKIKIDTYRFYKYSSFKNDIMIYNQVYSTIVLLSIIVQLLKIM